MNANFPRKCWYVAATASEVGAEPLGRKLLDTDVVLWRSNDGTVVALEDRCAHRGFPLSHGHPDSDRIICGYHGCIYRRDGRCVHVPTQPEVPAGMSVRAFPVFEEGSFIWIWLGTPTASLGTRPPRTPWLTSPDWSSFGDGWNVRANYMMVHEHYLDFSYAPVLHRADFPVGIDQIPPVDDIEITESSVFYRRQFPAVSLAPWEAEATGLYPGATYVRRESGKFASPALHVQGWEIEADGTSYSNLRTHAITPQTADSTHVFMQASHNYGIDDARVTVILRTFVSDLVHRDKTIVEMATARVGYEGWRSSVEFAGDVAALHARRIVSVMNAKESGRSAFRPGIGSSETQSTIPVRP